MTYFKWRSLLPNRPCGGGRPPSGCHGCRVITAPCMWRASLNASVQGSFARMWLGYPSTAACQAFGKIRLLPSYENIPFFIITKLHLPNLEWLGVGDFSKVVATFSHVGGSFNLFLATTGDVWIIPSFRIWDYVLHVEHVSCVITNCGQHQCVIPFPLSIAL